MHIGLIKCNRGVVMLEYIVVSSIMVLIFAICFSQWFYSPIDGYPEIGVEIHFEEDGSDDVTIPPGRAFYDYMQRLITGVALPIP